MRRAFLIAAAVFVNACESCESTELVETPGDIETSTVLIDFGDVRLDRSEDRALELKNGGTGPVIILSAELQSDQFAITRAVDKIPGGASAAIELRFMPRVLGVATATLAISSDSTAHPLIRVALRGNGVPVPICETDGDDCDDQNACTTDDTCVGGACVGQAIACDDGVACTRDVCDSTIGCTVIFDHNACPDDDPCSLDQCTRDGCEHPGAPDGYPCGPAVPCETAHVCILQFCLEVELPSDIPPMVVGESHLLTNERAAMFAGNYLFVEGRSRTIERTIVMKIDGDVAKPVADVPGLNIDHHHRDNRDRVSVSSWAQVSGSIYARVHTSSVGRLFLNVFDIANPEDVEILASRELTLGRAGTLATPAAAVRDGSLRFCAAGDRYIGVNLSDPRNPSDAVHLTGAELCGNIRPVHAATSQYWVSWSATGNFALHDLFGSPVLQQSIGAIDRVALDETRLIIDLQTDGEFRTIDLENSPELIEDAPIDLPEPVLLLAVHDKIGYFQAEGEIRAVDLTDPRAPVTLPYRAAYGEENLRLLAVSSNYLAFQGKPIFRTTENEAPIEVRGRGRLDRLYEHRRGYFGISNVTAAPYATNYELMSSSDDGQVQTPTPRVIDDSSGPIGLYAPPRPLDFGGDCYFDDLECDVRVPLASTSTTISTINLDLPAPPLMIDWPGGIIAGDACTVVVASDATLYRFDRCLMTSQGSTALPVGLGGAARIKMHSGGTFATILTDSAAIFVELGSQPSVIDHIAINRPLSAGYERDKWLITAGNELHVFGVTGIGAIHESTLTFAPEPELANRILGVRDHLVLIAGPKRGRTIIVADIAPIPAVELYQVELPSQPMDAVFEDGRAVIARSDGLTLLAPICRPE